MKTGRNSMVRFLVILGLLVGGIIIAFIADTVRPPWGGRLSGFIFFLVGVIYSERKIIMRWPMNIFKAARMLGDQEDHPERYLKPVIAKIDLFPKPSLPSNEVPYIIIRLAWDSHSFQNVRISDIQGNVSVNGHTPPDVLPSMIDNVDCAPQALANGSLIAIQLSGEGLKLVQRIRQQGQGRANILLILKAKLNGKDVSYEPFSETGYWVTQ
jgi:hypothetical protein